MVEPEFTWSKDIINHDDVGTDSRKESFESSNSADTREAMSSMQPDRPNG